uniref:Rpn family recombination-promoting nuclease/putative transposase n=1 Tax=Prevotella sp. TaxID=59823 RepID=UPI004027C89C
MTDLDPNADLTFKKVFGEHKDLLISLLNALLPLSGDEQVESVEYLPAELVPDLPMGKNSIVDVRCKDLSGRQFIVEMQMIWTPAFQQRVLFNASKAFVRQLRRNRKYELLQPVYSLNLVNETFMNDYPDEFIHNYNIVHELHSDKIIEGLHLTFVELPKFKPQTIAERKMAVLWLRFLTEINEETTVVPDELLQNPETSKALKEVEESAYTEHEMDAYEDFWDKLGAERLLLVDSNSISRKEGREEGREEGRKEERKDMAKKMLAMGMEKTTITKLTGLSDNELTMLFT